MGLPRVLAYTRPVRPRVGSPIPVTVAATLAVLLTWTNPSHQTDTLAVCGHAAADTCLDLAAIEVWGRARFAPADSLLDRRDAHGLEGLRASFSFSDPRIWTIWVVAVDDSGNRSCPSNSVAINLPAGVPPPTPQPHPALYDIAGRRVSDPTQPGVYFTRQNGRRRIFIR